MRTWPCRWGRPCVFFSSDSDCCSEGVAGEGHQQKRTRRLRRRRVLPAPCQQQFFPDAPILPTAPSEHASNILTSYIQKRTYIHSSTARHGRHADVHRGDAVQRDRLRARFFRRRGVRDVVAGRGGAQGGSPSLDCCAGPAASGGDGVGLDLDHKVCPPPPFFSSRVVVFRGVYARLLAQVFRVWGGGGSRLILLLGCTNYVGDMRQALVPWCTSDSSAFFVASSSSGGERCVRLVCPLSGPPEALAECLLLTEGVRRCFVPRPVVRAFAADGLSELSFVRGARAWPVIAPCLSGCCDISMF